jgi:hypothetical protein
MRTAYSGRAAAYEKKGDYDNALADHKMTVLFYAIEAEIVNALETPDRPKFLAEAARAYRARAQCLESLRRSQEATLDRKRADDLDGSARQLTNASTSSKEGSANAVHVFNSWTEPITLLVDGVSHRLAIGAEANIPAPAGSIVYAMEAGPHRASGTMQAGKTYTIRPAR